MRSVFPITTRIIFPQDSVIEIRAFFRVGKKYKVRDFLSSVHKKCKYKLYATRCS